MTDNILDTPVGDKERMALEPKRVKIINVDVKAPKEGSKARIVICTVEHPDAKSVLGQDTIDISQVKVENPKTHKLECVGLWENLDKDGKLQKGSTTAEFLKFMKANTLRELIGKDVDTVLRDNGFLAFKGGY